jgi:hypothetical protein
VKLGQYHTLELALQRNFTLTKANWDSIYLERIDIACDLKHSAEIAAVVMQPGLANVCLVTTHMTQVRQKIEQAIPRKRVGSTSGHDGALKKFYLAVYNAIKVSHTCFRSNLSSFSSAWSSYDINLQHPILVLLGDTGPFHSAITCDAACRTLIPSALVPFA